MGSVGVFLCLLLACPYDIPRTAYLPRGQVPISLIDIRPLGRSSIGDILSRLWQIDEAYLLSLRGGGEA